MLSVIDLIIYIYAFSFLFFEIGLYTYEGIMETKRMKNELKIMDQLSDVMSLKDITEISHETCETKIQENEVVTPKIQIFNPKTKTLYGIVPNWVLVFHLIIKLFNILTLLVPIFVIRFNQGNVWSAILCVAFFIIQSFSVIDIIKQLKIKDNKKDNIFYNTTI